MNPEEGKNYYVILHAYHHFLVTVDAVLGPDRIRCSRVVKVHSCQRGWTDFFKAGANPTDTVMMAFPPGVLNGFMAIFDWPHPVPVVKA